MTTGKINVRVSNQLWRPGVPSGGTVGQYIQKSSSADYDTEWVSSVTAAPHTIASHSDTSGTGAELDTLTDGSDADSLHAHATNDGLAHAEVHTIVSHSDTTATGAELNELTDASETILHSHASGISGAIDWENPILIDTATTLTISSQHIVSDLSSPADYTVTLPAEGANSGKMLSVYIDAGTTKMVTVSGTGFTKILWAGESLILQCDGTTWDITSYQQRQMGALAYSDTSQTGLTTGTFVQAVLGTEQWDDGSSFTANAYTVKRDGRYDVSVSASIRNESGGTGLTRAILAVYKNGAAIERVLDTYFINTSTGINPVIESGVVPLDLLKDDIITLYCYATVASGTWEIGGISGALRRTYLSLKERLS